MTPFEIELLKTVWPWAWTTMLGIVGLYLRSLLGHLDNRLNGISNTLNQFGEDLRKTEREMIDNREEMRHRLDRLIGESDSRIGRIEAVCETQHGILRNRRSTDSRPINWAQESDIAGGKLPLS